ncbi:hypothetical protein BO86DRAFT_300109 [Aspergillus japonicus CBS 114.51]|uniref:Alpha-1,3-glucanase/mutanase n=1 Tax=Aspergillus japonicus CBS 114.51 TaxID=1448312 RepID=A0A8T8XGM9_ASPJA|nr:hypothetical protein BO86DRAFT_300109 [Aspergillus japonicus CBS 114.51]RAH87503.1 hypothetical protein BO86DRAFT_300109 [Aspergillus japonicus CBS 114.51]
MVSNTLQYTVDDWENEMTLANEANLDAFALNIAVGDATNTGSVANAFLAAENVGFSLFFSFDYAGNGAWAESDVVSMISTYAQTGAYFQHAGKPLVSTFEGPDNAADWVSIKEQTGCFFVPDWSSVGAEAAAGLADGVADGLFSWAAWPYGPNNMNTYTDASYIDFLDGKPYMMPVSPWFFTNMPGYNKNWLWRGDDLWYDRWEQAMYLAPEFIEIISWNDFGESHYIGPIQASGSALADSTYTAFGTGEAPYNYVLDMPHDGWRVFLPWLADTYKQNISSITQEGVQAWYRRNVGGECASDGGTTGNTASQLQLEYWPYEIGQNKVFFSALLGSTADITVTIGGEDMGAQWNSTPSGGAGMYHGFVSFSVQAGAVEVAISRNGATIASFTGADIVIGCSSSTNIENWNAWVGSAMASATIDAKPTYSLLDAVCIEGWGTGNFDGLCAFTCSLGYCPVGACLCKKMGPQPELPKSLGVVGYPIAGETADYSGLCAFACNYGYCPPAACGTTEVALTVTTASPFTPATCTAGQGEGDLAGLCSYACNYGFCPIHNCTCTSTGPLNVPPVANTSIYGFYSGSGSDSGLCDFACERGYCPSPTCLDDATTTGTGDGDDDDDDLVCADDGTDTRAVCDEESYTGCDYSVSFTSFNDLSTAAASYNASCVNYYLIGVLSSMLDDTLANYTQMNGSYHDKFEDYVSFVKEEVPNTLDTLMAAGGAGNAYFECTYSAGGITNISTTSCPYQVPQTADDVDVNSVIYYDLVNATGWWDMLLSDYGLQSSWVQLGERVIQNYCSPTATNTLTGSICHEQTYTWKGYPVAATDLVVADPATIIQTTLPNIQNLTETLTLTRILISSGAWGGSLDDIVLSVSTAVFTLVQAVQNMAQIEAIATQYEEAQKKELIEEIIGALFLVVPFLGEIDVISESLAGLADIITMIGDTAMLADSIYEVVSAKSAKDAILGIFGVLLLGGVRSVEEFSDMANLRRGLSADDIAKIGPDWEEADTEMNKLVDVCF